MGIYDWVQGLFSDPPAAQAKPYAADPVTHYPTTDDTAFAKQQDWSYGQPYDPYFKGQRSTYVASDPNYSDFKTESEYGSKGLPEDYYARGALAANRSALATLGFDPSRVGADVWHDPRKVSVLGLTYPGGNMYANAGFPSTLVHESIHRGIDKLAGTPYWKKEFNQFSGGTKLNEALVRHLMKTQMGDPEVAFDNRTDLTPDKNLGQQQRQWSDQLYKSNPSYQNLTDQMENAAAQYLAHRQPMGPR